MKLEGLNRHASIHAAGEVIAPRPIIEFAPLYKSTKDEITTQFTMNDVEYIGLLKMDFLGLTTLTVIDDTVRSIQTRTGETVDIHHLPLDDPRVYELFSQGATDGIFQFESAGMKGWLRKLKPSRFTDLIAMNALYRPGPIGSGMIDEYIKCRHGQKKITYPHPDLEQSLKETYGVIVYQEQVMQIASKLAGYSMGDADILRKAMGKKKESVMQAQRAKFVSGAKQNGVAPKKAGEIFDLMAHFAGYGFNKSHSTAYALIAYQTAYLKVHYPYDFTAALLTSEQHKTDKLDAYIKSSKQAGIPVLPPDVNESDVSFTVAGDGEGIRFGLGAIKNVGEGAAQAIVDTRRAKGTFPTFTDFVEWVDSRAINKKVIESLVKAGCFDRLGYPRARVYAAIATVMQRAERTQRDAREGQVGLFGTAAAAGTEDLPEAAEWSQRERLGHEKEALGFYITDHPLTAFERDLTALCDSTTQKVINGDVQGEVSLGGVVTKIRKHKTRKGDWMARCTVEDLTGAVEVTVFPDTFKNAYRYLEKESVVFLRGQVDERDGNSEIKAIEVLPLDRVKELKAKGLLIRGKWAVVGQEEVDRISEAVQHHPGNCPLYIDLVDTPQGTVRIQTSSDYSVSPTPGFCHAVEAILGEQATRFLF